MSFEDAEVKIGPEQRVQKRTQMAHVAFEQFTKDLDLASLSAEELRKLMVAAYKGKDLFYSNDQERTRVKEEDD